MKHIPVLLKKSIEALNIKEDGIYLDLTLGRAGHSQEILKKLTTGHLYCFDKDQQAIDESQPILAKISPNFTLIKSDFQNFDLELAKLNIFKVDGILADLGVSSPQLDDFSRGFSYSKDSYLDMRMDQTQKLDAHYIVNNYSEAAIKKLLQFNADVKLARQVAKAICNNRPIDTTLQLSTIIKNTYPAYLLRQKNPLKAVFQAIRIEVNGELESLQVMLSKVDKILNKNGILAIISFHSIEDKMIKTFFNSLKLETSTYKLPIQMQENYKIKKIIVSDQEKNTNYRSRSATLRTLQKLID
ncbi:16S rRNA (cytosine(1402)-N(4))-methyltransferase RsmH [Mycoplasma miroungirhinis]|uniref:Ribosomal RNA small subunit methyltransferase H n=1 Tax=Mycoplasma miroungirhinis TaxID=754516 RepID=A0A6M4JEE0_9MOLU|nr:16S rRNA (cytosine(1402)-N(4))-methyltransferase RsmH [Mycoplasma miroungirhinis]